MYGEKVRLLRFAVFCTFIKTAKLKIEYIREK